MIRLILTLAFTAVPLTVCAQAPKTVATDVVVLSVPSSEIDGLTHTTALAMLAEGKAELVAHASISTPLNQRAKIDFHRGHKYAKTMTRRGDTSALPVRCGIWPVGNQLVVDPQLSADGESIDVTIDQQIHVADPLPSPLAGHLAAMAKNDEEAQEVPRPKLSELRHREKLEGIKTERFAISYAKMLDPDNTESVYAILTRITVR